MQSSLLQIIDVIVSRSSGEITLAGFLWSVFAGVVKPHKALVSRPHVDGQS